MSETADDIPPVALQDARAWTLFAAMYRGTEWVVRALEDIRAGDILDNAVRNDMAGVIIADRTEADRRKQEKFDRQFSTAQGTPGTSIATEEFVVDEPIIAKRSK